MDSGQREFKANAFFQLRDLIQILMESQPRDQFSKEFQDWEKLSEKTLDLYAYYKEVLGNPNESH